MHRGPPLETALLVPIVVLLGAGLVDLWAVARAHGALSEVMRDAAVSWEAADGPAETHIPAEAAFRFERRDGRPARFRIVPGDGGTLQLSGIVKVRPPFGLLGQELKVGHTVVVERATVGGIAP